MPSSFMRSPWKACLLWQAWWDKHTIRSLRCQRVELCSRAPAHLLEDPGSLAQLDQVAVGVTQIAADLHPMVLGLGQELAAARAPLLIDGVDIGHADVHRAAQRAGVPRRLGLYVRLVVGRAALAVEHDVAVGEAHHARFALAQHRRAEHPLVELA